MLVLLVEQLLVLRDEKQSLEVRPPLLPVSMRNDDDKKWEYVNYSMIWEQEVGVCELFDDLGTRGGSK